MAESLHASRHSCKKAPTKKTLKRVGEQNGEPENTQRNKRNGRRLLNADRGAAFLSRKCFVPVHLKTSSEVQKPSEKISELESMDVKDDGINRLGWRPLVYMFGSSQTKKNGQDFERPTT